MSNAFYPKQKDYINQLNILWNAVGNGPVQSVVGLTGIVTLAQLVTGGVAPLDSAPLTGIPTAPTATAGTSTTQLSTCAFTATAIANSLADANPQALGSVAIGTSVRMARQDHVHANPTLNSLANVTITSPTTGDLLSWNGTVWVNKSLSTAGIALSATTISAGNGMSGGGDLTANQTLTLGTPSTVTGATSNSASGTTHTHALSSNLQAWDGVTVASMQTAPVTQALTDGATVTWAIGSGDVATWTIGGNRTMAAPTGMKVGTFILKLKQDATGSRTVTWNGVFKWAAGVAPSLSTAANATDLFSFFCDGTNMYGSYLRGVA